MYKEEEAQKGMSGEKPEKLLDREKTDQKETGKDSARGAMNRMMDRISKCMSDDSINRISILGWEGMGRSTIIKKVVEQHSYRFDDVKQVSASDCDDAEDLQTKIKEALDIKKDVKDVPNKIASALNVKKVLLVLEDVRRPIKLDDVISPDWEVITKGSTKVVVTTSSQEVCTKMGIKVNIGEEMGILSEDEAWDLLCQEATALSQLSELKKHFVSDSGGNVMQCFVYCLSFLEDISIDALTLYPMSEGFICGFRNWKEMQEFGSSLGWELLVRSILEANEKEERLFVPSSIKSKVVPFLNREGSSYSHSTQIRFKGFLLRLDAEAPKVLKGDVERALLVGANLQKFEDAGLPLDCPQLATLILSENPQLRELPDQAFKCMQRLGVLDLSGTGISSLPSSLSCLSKLKLLALRNCHDLNDLPVSLIVSHLGKLQVLHLEGTPLQKLTEASLDNMGELVYLNISAASNLTKLSLKGCRSLQRLCAPKSLEVLDLSSTGIEDLAEVDISELNNLKSLVLLDTKNLTRAPWYKIRHLPEKLVWDQCSSDYSKAAKANQGYYCISVADPEIFKNLTLGSPLWDRYFEKFRFSIVSPDRRNDKDGDEDPFLSKHFIYNGIYAAQTQQQHYSSQLARSYDRCLVINGGHHSPLNIGGVLYNTESLYLSNDVIEQFLEFDSWMLSNLKDCRIEKCHRMKALLKEKYFPTEDSFEKLENLWVFDLENLQSVADFIYPPTFSCLRSMYIEHCPCLSCLFHEVLSLESLETLEIRFCGKLTEVIRMDGGKPFPRLRELCLWELPSLISICEGDLPALNKLKVRGCQMLDTLPIYDKVGPEMETHVVDIRGEPEWWKNMDWQEQGAIPKCVRFKGLPKFQWN